MRYCPPYSKTPKGWQRDQKGRWTCLRCHRTGLLVRHRHIAHPPAVSIPVYGDRNGSRKEIVGYALVSPIDAYLLRYKWRGNVTGYVYRQTWAWRKGKYRRHNEFLHRSVLGLEPDNPLEGHHRDDNRTNCQRWNLERVTRSQNERYKHARRSTGLP